MDLKDFKSTTEQTVRIAIEVNGKDGFIEVYGITSRKYAEAMSWFKRACSQKVMAGVELIGSASVMGEQVPVHSDEYSKLNTILFAHLICDWSFDNDLTLDSAAELLIHHPSLCTEIDERTSMMAYAEATAKKPQSPTQEAK